MIWKKGNAPLRSIHTTQNHWTGCPSNRCQEETLPAFQTSKPGDISLYIGMLVSRILAILSPRIVELPLILRFIFCTLLLCFPLILGMLTVSCTCRRPSWQLFIEDSSLELVTILSQMDFPVLEDLELVCSYLSSFSRSATKLFTVSAVNSVADSRACSLRN